MSNPTLVTLDDFKTHLGITSDDDDTRLSTVLCGIEQSVKGFCRNDILSAEATEYYDGTGDGELVLKRRPVTAISTVRVDANGAYGNGSNVFGSTTEWEFGTAYTIRSLSETSRHNDGILKSLKGRAPGWAQLPGIGVWPEGVGNIKVTYTAGYSSTPDDLALAIFQLASAAWAMTEEKGLAPVSEETIGRYSYTLMRGDEQAVSGINLVNARAALERYRLEEWF